MYPGLKIKLNNSEAKALMAIFLQQSELLKENSANILAYAAKDFYYEQTVNTGKRLLTRKAAYSFTFSPVDVYMLSRTWMFCESLYKNTSYEYHLFNKISAEINRFETNIISLPF